MPPKKYNGPNAHWVKILEELRDARKDDDNRHLYLTLCKAVTGLKAEQRELRTYNDLLSVKGIGEVIAKKMQRAAEGNGDGDDAPAQRVGGRAVKRRATDVDVDLAGPSRPAKTKKRVASDVASAPTVPTRVRVEPQVQAQEDVWFADVGFPFFYLDTDGNPVKQREKAECCIDDRLRFKIIYPVSASSHPFADELANRATRGAHLVGDMDEVVAETFPLCPGGFEVGVLVVPKNAKTSSKLREMMAEEEDNQKSRRQNTLDPSRQLPARYSQPNAAPPLARSATIASEQPSTSQRPKARPIARSVTMNASEPARPRLSDAIRAPAPIDHPSIYLPQTTFPDFEPMILRAGTYRVKMVLDHRERAGVDATLQRKGFQPLVESLELGDVTWVAEVAGGQRYVLDVILERKRLDDLVSSITDGRFHEQKFRLKQSAISRVFYLVEEYNTQQNKADWGVQISTALSSTQIADSFFVKETKNVHDTVSFLIGLTEQIGRDHQNKDLYVIPQALIKRHSYFDLQKYLRSKYPPGPNQRTYITSFEDFQHLNRASNFITVRDTWARMLLCIRGMGAEKVGAVVNRWGTPREFWEALKAAEREEARARARVREEEEANAAAAAGGKKGKGKGRKKKSSVPLAKLMLKGVGGSEGGVRAIGNKLSTDIYDLFRKEDFVGMLDIDEDSD
ncbi:ERCC4 domain-containing protein [Mycena chlorophos]|uniref:Crossover junction endonuclease MUS81 n=1 Tax=Mycena chlorophos TaxID=658473 RepID=A0A8H6TKG6_MYCCL|nr:ERCC4 domain-containing protein [Mycena chlorophos]